MSSAFFRKRPPFRRENRLNNPILPVPLPGMHKTVKKCDKNEHFM